MSIAVGVLVLLLLGGLGCDGDSSFQFVFMTDIHVQPEERAAEGFQMAIDEVNDLAPDFVITGGDLIMDALAQPYSRADRLYELFASLSQGFQMPVYHTIGNHELFGIHPGSGVSPDDPYYGKALYQDRIGSLYYSFDHKGWHFILLDSIQPVEEDGVYQGEIDADQMNWIRQDLERVDPSTPICVSTHIPFVTVFNQMQSDNLTPLNERLVVRNSHSVLSLFENHNLKLVLQGHLHIVEEIRYKNVSFITGGAVCAAWWKGPRRGFEEGFVRVDVKGDSVSWQYEDIPWTVEAEE
jgi:3',5'-cyclic AMP phosphodiesterase CpdA